MSIGNRQRMPLGGARFTVAEAANAETDGPGPEVAESLVLAPVAVTEFGHGLVTNGTELDYQASAEDNIAGFLGGMLDDEPGVIYTGGVTGQFNTLSVTVKDITITEGAIAPGEAEDFVTVGLFVNSSLKAIADEGFSIEGAFVGEPGAGLIANIRKTEITVTEGDVIRIALVGPEANEELVDWDVDAEGVVEIR